MPYRLLIVDDAVIIRMRIKEIALAAGWQVIAEGTNGEEAIALYETHRPDLVTLDIVMPKLDGVKALREIRRRDPQARVSMVSAVNQKEKLTECIHLGAVDFIVKPFDKQRLQGFFDKQARSLAVVHSSAAGKQGNEADE